MRHLAAGAAVALATLALPFLIYGALAFKTFGLFAPSGYAPTEALAGAYDSGGLAALWRAPVLSLNATSGELIAAMYEVTVGSLALAIALGAAFAVHRSRRAICSRPAAAGAGGGVLAAVVGAHTALLGCCGGAGAGGILSLAGAGAAASGAASFGQPVQILCIAALLLHGAPKPSFWSARRGPGLAV
ncbi:hypothetical protein GCM10008171_06070 [Methylopila jiangsuensis]|uniref:Uncharacterized protein n=1 Tax=Methylopila jiangsuensis TaxID=586230 RepID=A0A9W6JGY5_9HYPH|nr:hypothetical protein [Methylopila jiangsuensis]MDR6285594.1 hypothetical protein [Methylopila jiangsuensis]GLK75353.1 hypothetical protein GCM10008171_06070 [Methylopila jiangsuensis]